MEEPTHIWCVNDNCHSVTLKQGIVAMFITPPHANKGCHPNKAQSAA